MPIVFKCPKCAKMYKVKDELAGKVAGCTCGVKFKIPAPKPKPVIEPPEEPDVSPEEQAEASSAVKTPPPPPPPQPKDVEEEELVDDEPAADMIADDDFQDEPEEEPVEDESIEEEPIEEPIEDEIGEAPEPEDEEPEDVDESPDNEAEDSRDDEPVEDVDAAADDEDDAEAADKEEDDDNEEEEEEEVVVASKGWPGRILVILGAALVIAGLFLAWTKDGGAVQKTVPAVTSDDKNTEDTDDADDESSQAPRFNAGGVKLAIILPRVADKSGRHAQHVIAAEAEETPARQGDEAAGGDKDAGDDDADDDDDGDDDGDDDDAEDGDGAAVAVSGPGFRIPLEHAAGNPMLWAIYAVAGVAVVLLILALIPFLSGTVGMIVGIILSLAVAGSAAAVVLGLSKSMGMDPGALLGNAGLGLYLTLGGAVLCFVGGLLMSFTVLKGASAAKPAGKPARGRGGRRERGGARPARAKAEPRKGSGSTVRVAPPKRGAKAEDEEAADDEADDGEDEAGEEKPAKKPLKPPSRQGGKLKPPFAVKKKAKASRKIMLKPKGKGPLKPPGSSRRKK